MQTNCRCHRGEGTLCHWIKVIRGAWHPVVAVQLCMREERVRAASLEEGGSGVSKQPSWYPGCRVDGLLDGWDKPPSRCVCGQE